VQGTEFIPQYHKKKKRKERKKDGRHEGRKKGRMERKEERKRNELKPKQSIDFPTDAEQTYWKTEFLQWTELRKWISKSGE
jgi:hypothetical protein